MKSVTIRDQNGNILIKVIRTKIGIETETANCLTPLVISAMCYTDTPKKYTKIKVRTGERK